MPEEWAIEELNLQTFSQAGSQVATGQSGERLPGNAAADTSSPTGPQTATDGVSGMSTVAKKKDGATTSDKPFILSEGLPPVPAKLVARMLRGEFIDMMELLRDNLEAQRRAALQETLAIPGPSMHRPHQEVPDILSWVQCFSIYTAVIASKFPERVQKLLAYQTLIVREARRCGGRGWLSYDTFFHQQMVGEWRGDEWGRLNPYLFSSTFLAFGGQHRPNCTLCLEPDHQEDDCALAKSKSPYLPVKQSSPRNTPWESTLKSGKGKAPRTTVCFSWNQGSVPFPIVNIGMSAYAVVGSTRSYTVVLSDLQRNVGP